MPTEVQLTLCVKLFSQWTSGSIISNYLIISHNYKDKDIQHNVL